MTHKAMDSSIASQHELLVLRMHKTVSDSLWEAPPYSNIQRRKTHTENNK